MENIEKNINIKKLSDKRYVGILLSAISMLVSIILNEIFTPNILTTKHYVFKGILNIIISVIIIFSIKPLYGKTLNEIFHFGNSKIALISGIGILVLIVFYIIKILINLKDSYIKFTMIIGMLILSLTVGLFQGIVIVFLATKGYFYLENKTIIFKYLYPVAGALIYSILNSIASNGIFESFYHDFALIFTLATIYIMSHNIVITTIIAIIFSFVSTLLSAVILSSIGGLFNTVFNNGRAIYNLLYTLMLIASIAMIYVMSKEPQEPKVTREVKESEEPKEPEESKESEEVKEPEKPIPAQKGPEKPKEPENSVVLNVDADKEP